jgi:hypothetical protein
MTNMPCVLSSSWLRTLRRRGAAIRPRPPTSAAAQAPSAVARPLRSRPCSRSRGPSRRRAIRPRGGPTIWSGLARRAACPRPRVLRRAAFHRARSSVRASSVRTRSSIRGMSQLCSSSCCCIGALFLLALCSQSSCTSPVLPSICAGVLRRGSVLSPVMLFDCM